MEGTDISHSDAKTKSQSGSHLGNGRGRKLQKRVDYEMWLSIESSESSLIHRKSVYNLSASSIIAHGQGL